MENNGKPKGNHTNGVVVVRPAAEIMSRQQLPYYVGISEITAGAKNISMNLIIIPPGGAAEPHLHKGYETAIYLLKGRVDTRYGEQLENSVICETGDFIYIQADVPHQPINLSTIESALALVARNDANEQEHVVTIRGNGIKQEPEKASLRVKSASEIVREMMTDAAERLPGANADRFHDQAAQCRN